MDELNMDCLYSQEAEAEVIGGIICRGRQALDEVPELKPEHFYNFQLAAAFRAAQALSDEGQDPNLITIENWLQANEPAAFDRELLSFIHGNTGFGGVAPATFGWLCVETGFGATAPAHPIRSHLRVAVR